MPAWCLARLRPSAQAGAMRTLPGLALALALSAGAVVAGTYAPVIGAPVVAIILAGIVGHLLHHPSVLVPGAKLASGVVLQASVVVLGAGLSLAQVVHVGGASLPVMLGTLAIALAGSWLLGRVVGVDAESRTLIGVGTGICGASAIAAVSSVTRPKDAHVAYAMGTIFTFNVAAVLIFPVLGRLVGMTGHQFGLWSGTAVNDTSSVVAAAYSFGHGAGPYAIVVKLTRALMIVPITIALALLRARRDGQGSGLSWRVVPPFIVLFVVAAALNSAGAIPPGWHHALTTLGTFLITVALGGIGLQLRVAEVRKAGTRPLVLGGLLWILVAVSSLGLQAATGPL